MEKLEKETDAKRRKAMRTQALFQKAISLSAAIINIAEAITKALTLGPFLGVAAATWVKILGAIQIAAILAAPIPAAAKGGWIPSPMPVMAGHGQYGELILRPEQIPQVVKEIIKEPFKTGGEPFKTGGGVNITIVVQDQLDPYTAQRITRQQIIPQILESLDINENKRKWQERLGI